MKCTFCVHHPSPDSQVSTTGVAYSISDRQGKSMIGPGYDRNLCQGQLEFLHLRKFISAFQQVYSHG